MKANGWTWDEPGKCWILKLGNGVITVRLPRSDPPEFSANLFGIRKP